MKNAGKPAISGATILKLRMKPAMLGRIWRTHKIIKKVNQNIYLHKRKKRATTWHT